jgi:ATP phosphoribosyltransferase regulatory subunit|tara:strand:+ start:1349 stop:2530 length:1182 start_codon:yes stop_codon:yes gene_type:complete
MALQPASGAQDLLPRDVGANRWICEQLAAVYNRWGYAEVMPPSLERLDTLEAGGAIESSQVLQVVADEPLGLRPEMTASIARAACTRLAAMPRPLRLHYRGSTFKAQRIEDQGIRIAEDLQSGVELMGAPGLAGDSELLRLLLDAARGLPFSADQSPTLLIGHQGLLELLLSGAPEAQQPALRHVLCALDRVSLKAMDLEPGLAQRYLAVMDLRGEPHNVLAQLEQMLGSTSSLLHEISQLVNAIQRQAVEQGIRLQLDPTFHPDFELYDGLMVKLVCQGDHAPIAIASGGRYDRLVQRFTPGDDQATGVGFSFAVEGLRQLLQSRSALPGSDGEAVQLVAFSRSEQLQVALDRLQEIHRQGQRAELWPDPCTSQMDAEQIAVMRGGKLVWLS